MKNTVPHFAIIGRISGIISVYTREIDALRQANAFNADPYILGKVDEDTPYYVEAGTFPTWHARESSDPFDAALSVAVSNGWNTGKERGDDETTERDWSVGDI